MRLIGNRRAIFHRFTGTYQVTWSGANQLTARFISCIGFIDINPDRFYSFDQLDIRFINGRITLPAGPSFNGQASPSLTIGLSNSAKLVDNYKDGIPTAFPIGNPSVIDNSGAGVDAIVSDQAEWDDRFDYSVIQDFNTFFGSNPQGLRPTYFPALITSLNQASTYVTNGTQSFYNYVNNGARTLNFQSLNYRYLGLGVSYNWGRSPLQGLSSGQTVNVNVCGTVSGFLSEYLAE